LKRASKRDFKRRRIFESRFTRFNPLLSDLHFCSFSFFFSFRLLKIWCRFDVISESCESFESKKGIRVPLSSIELSEDIWAWKSILHAMDIKITNSHNWNQISCWIGNKSKIDHYWK
jgi:hypothetical protein